MNPSFCNLFAPAWRAILLAMLTLAPCVAVWAAEPAGETYQQTRQRLLDQLNSIGAATATTAVRTAVSPAPAAPEVMAPASTNSAQPASLPPAASAPPATNASPVAVASVAPGAGSVPPVPATLTDAAVDEVTRLLDDRRKLNVGDRVAFRILEDREDPKQLVIADSGELEVPYVGRVKAAGKTCLQLAKELKSLLEKDYYHRATISLAVDALSRSRGKVYVYGQVRQPNFVEMPVDETMTVSKAILRVGGFSDFAKKDKVRITRKAEVAGEPNKLFIVNVDEVLKKGRQDMDLELQADDWIYVDQRIINF
jgi:polysaccharide export outer membrane protein